MRRPTFRLLFAIAASLVLMACTSATPAATVSPPTAEPTATATPLPPTATPTTPPPSATPLPPTATATLAPTATPTATLAPSLPALPAEAQEIVFHAEDGQELRGLYYPGAANPAPLVVMMHWAGGDLHDWDVIGPWLQNRGPLPVIQGVRGPWQIGAWFPAMPSERSYAVFTFTFRGCEGGCRKLDRRGWLLDAQAAMRAARELEGIDPQRIAAVGASIGADGAPDGCFLLNEEFPGSCQGALSLSPGDYLTVPYAEAVTKLGSEKEPKPAWCFYAAEDQASADACRAAQGANYRTFEYAGRAHGMALISPQIEPAVLPLLIEFLQAALG